MNHTPTTVTIPDLGASTEGVSTPRSATTLKVRAVAMAAVSIAPHALLAFGATVALQVLACPPQAWSESAAANVEADDPLLNLRSWLAPEAFPLLERNAAACDEGGDRHEGSDRP